MTKKPWVSLDVEVLGTFGLSHDVTEIIQAEKNLERVAEELKSINQEISEERNLLRLVIDNMPVFVYFKDLNFNFTLVNQKLAELLGAESPEEVENQHNSDFFEDEIVSEAGEDERRVMRTGKPLVRKLEKMSWKDNRISWFVTSKYPWYAPDGSLMGTFGISSDVTQLVEVKLQLERITKVLGQQNEAMEKQLELAREIQQAALPGEVPLVQDAASARVANFHHRYQPASQLAGDFFEVISLGDGCAGFLVCDVMGHGVRSALIVSMLRGLIERQREELGDQPGAFLSGLNDGLCHLLKRTRRLIFSTAIYGYVDLSKGELSLSSAGHPDPIVMRDGEASILKVEEPVKGPALGMVAGFEFQEVVLPLESLDAIWAFTDGIFEALGTDGEEFGEERMCQALQAGPPDESALDRVVNAAMDFSGATGFEDDLCVVGVDFTGGA